MIPTRILRSIGLVLFALALMSASAPSGAKQADRDRAQGTSRLSRESGTLAVDPPAASRPEGRAVRPAAKRKGIHPRGPHKRRLQFKKVRHKRVRPAEDNPNKHANIALICGILCLTLANIVPFGGIVSAILAIAHGAKSISAEEPKRGAAIAGIVLGVLYCTFLVIVLSYVIVMLLILA